MVDYGLGGQASGNVVEESSAPGRINPIEAELPFELVIDDGVRKPRLDIISFRHYSDIVFVAPEEGVLDGLLELIDSITAVSAVNRASLMHKARNISSSGSAALLDAESLSSGEEGSGSECLHCSFLVVVRSFLLLNYIAKAALL